MQPQKLTLSNLLVGGGGLVTFIFSFLKFFKQGPFGFNAWDGDGLAFVSTVPAILGLAALVWVALDLFGVKLPNEVLTFNAAQIKATWGISAAGLMIAFLTVDMGGIGKGPGFWLMLIGSLAMGVGAVLGLLGIGNDPLSTPKPAQPGGLQAPTAPPPPPPPPTGGPAAPPPPPPPPV